ncbi:keratin, type II cytoskeletal 1-like isoform X2 [Hylaeus volcanicus]|uniref:keratin, type II cytoskeletal 1-like isoform X2 n=1 Tax=Hylaeus volcanicus TaxID=313075 RepID=UPI0023B8455E|nr:keratin, type II cytoskeletal 1-like isoform X2 [Hylaeus volcanicus]
MISETSWSLRALALLLVVAAISALPTSDPSADVVIDPIIVDDTTLSTELKPPPIPEKEHQYVLFVINLFAVKNSSGESAEEIFENEVVEKVPSLLGPLATVFLLVEVDGNDTETNEPVNLDEVATDLEDVEGFKVEKIKENGETKLLKVNLDQNDIDGMMPSKSKLEKMTKVRNKRSPCLKCKLKGFHGGGGGYGGGGGGGYGGGGGVGYPSYHQPSGGGCNTCGGGGGGGSYAQASASAGSWGK